MLQLFMFSERHCGSHNCHRSFGKVRASNPPTKRCLEALSDLNKECVNVFFNSDKPFSNLKIASSAIVAWATLTCGTAFAANQNEVLESFEEIRTNWSNPVSAWINDSSESNPTVSIGDQISIGVNSSTPAYFLLALVDTYGHVDVIRLNGTGTDDLNPGHSLTFPPAGADWGLQATAPVGQYSMFILASDVEVPGAGFGLPGNTDSVRVTDSPDGLSNFFASIKSFNASHNVAMATEYQFLIEDNTLAMRTRGLRKHMAKQQKVIKPAVATTVALTEPPVIETEPLALDIKFQFDSATLTDRGINQLDSLASALMSLQRAGALPSILLEGHTDDVGDQEYNLDLSRSRAETARAYLVSQFDLPPASVRSEGYGESQPKVANTDSDARTINRRVELTVLK